MGNRVKKIIIIAVIILALLLTGGLIALSVTSTVNHISYDDTMKLARELQLEIDAIHQEKGCSEAISSVNAAAVNAKTYASYIDSCRSMTSNIETLIRNLEENSGIERDPTLKMRFERFRDLYRETMPTAADFETRLKPYEIWHSYVLAATALTPASPDEEFEKAANILKTSSNPNSSSAAFATYADGWLERVRAYNEAYHAYADLDPADPDQPALKAAADKLHASLQQWEAVNMPDLTTISGLRFGNLAAMNDEFHLFYEATKSAYEASL